MKARASSVPPKTMTWPKATPFMLVALVFDIARAFFNFFWLFGPALIATGVGGVEGAALGLAAGYIGAPAFIFLGVVMAMAVGLLGWMFTLTILLLFNSRIFSPGSLVTVLFGFCISELPLLGALPTLTGTTLRLFHAQIKREHKALEAWKKEQAALRAQQQAEYLAYLAESEQDRALAEEEDEVIAEIEEEMFEKEEQEQEDERRMTEETEEEENAFREAA